MSLAQAEVLVRTKDLTKDEWLGFRRKGIGGSDIGAICGVNPWRSAMSVYLDKLNELPPIEENDAMHFGTKLESLVADEYKERTGHRVERRNSMYHHQKHEWALANIDRIILDKVRGDGILEVKTASEYSNKDWSEGIVPEQYQLQLQWYLWVTGLQWGAFAVLVGGNKFYTYELDRDETTISYMVDIAEKFWYGVQNRIPPAFDGSEDSKNVLKTLYPMSERTEIDLTVPAADLFEKYEKTKTEEAYWSDKKSEAENLIKEMIGNNERARIGESIITWKSAERHTVDSKRLQAEQPDIYERYLKTSSSRTFRVK